MASGFLFCLIGHYLDLGNLGKRLLIAKLCLKFGRQAPVNFTIAAVELGRSLLSHLDFYFSGKRL
jgi:hypothetical protein